MLSPKCALPAVPSVNNIANPHCKNRRNPELVPEKIELKLEELDATISKLVKRLEPKSEESSKLNESTIEPLHRTSFWRGQRKRKVNNSLHDGKEM